MCKRNIKVPARPWPLGLALAALGLGIGYGPAFAQGPVRSSGAIHQQSGTSIQTDGADSVAASKRQVSKMRTTTQYQRKTAAARMAARRGAMKPLAALNPGAVVPVCSAPTGQANADYMGLCPNWAYSPILR